MTATAAEPAAKARRTFWLLLLVLGASVAFPVAVVLSQPRATLSALTFPVYFVILLLVVTSRTRSVPARWALWCFLWGASVGPLAAVPLVLPLLRWFGADSGLVQSLFVPLLEESLKIGLVLLLMTLPWWRYRWTVGASDLLVLGAAVGAGFSFAEDSWRALGNSFAANAVWTAHRETPHWGWLYCFPSLEAKMFLGVGRRDPHPVPYYLGHAGATAFLALAIGASRLWGHRRRLLRWSPLVVWLWIMIDHGLYNLLDRTDTLAAPWGWLYAADGGGQASTWVLYLAIAATMAGEWRLLAKVGARAAAVDPRAVAPVAPLRLSVNWLLARLARRTLAREFRGLCYGLHRHELGGRRPGPHRDLLARLARSLRAWRLVSAPSVPPKPAANP